MMQPDYDVTLTRDWAKSQMTADKKPHALNTLHQHWFPIVAGHLQPAVEPPLVQHEDDVDSARFLRRNLATEVSEEDIDGMGSFSARELERELRAMPRAELENELGLSWNKVGDIIRRADPDRDGRITYREFLDTMQQYRLSSEQASTFKSIVRAFAYAEEFSCYPPTLFMVLITALETALFVYHVIHLPQAHGLSVGWDGPVPFCSVLIYNPHRRWEAWRFLTYMLVHIGIGHFVFNMIMQILVGVFLEMQQEGWLGSLRVAAVYLAGVLAGSLGTSLSDPNTYIAGASGGVYALIAAHLATLALNWKEDSAVKIRKVIHKPLTRIIRLVFIVALSIHDVAFAIYVRYFSDGTNTTGFMGHFSGALAGLLVGIFVLDNRRVQTWEVYVSYAAFSLFSLLLLFAILWNIFGDQWMGHRVFPRPDYRPYDDHSGNCKHYEFM